jgi:hypothetical protein
MIHLAARIECPAIHLGHFRWGKETCCKALPLASPRNRHRRQERADKAALQKMLAREGSGVEAELLAFL